MFSNFRRGLFHIPWFEEKDSILGWRPLAFFQDLAVGGLVVWICVVLLVLAVGAFFYYEWRRRHVSVFFSPSFFLALAPVFLCSFVAIRHVYELLVPRTAFGPPGYELWVLRRPGYDFQFGFLLSAVLVGLHYLFYAVCRLRRSSLHPSSKLR
jgi:hypothetical protein